MQLYFLKPMNTLFVFSRLIVLLIAINGCTPVPAVMNKPAAPVPENVSLAQTSQMQVQSMGQWQVVADDLAEQLIKSIHEKKLGNRPIYIFSQTKQTPFTRAFNDFLITTLVNKGLKVSTQKKGSHIFNYKIQLVEYNSLRGVMLDEKFKFTSLGAGFVVVRNIEKLLNVDGSVLASAALLDLTDMNIAPNMEIIITSSLLDGPLFINRTTDIYYANSLDKHLYLSPESQRNLPNTFNEPFYQLR